MRLINCYKVRSQNYGIRYCNIFGKPIPQSMVLCNISIRSNTVDYGIASCQRFNTAKNPEL